MTTKTDFHAIQMSAIICGIDYEKFKRGIGV